MKKSIKALVFALVFVSFACAAIAIIGHSMQTANAARGTMLAAAAICAVYSLWKFSIQMVRKTDHPGKNRADGITPTHRVWPMWAFLGFFLIEVALAAACIYLATHMWTVRDLLNFELTAILSGIIVYWFTHCLTKKA